MTKDIVQVYRNSFLGIADWLRTSFVHYIYCNTEGSDYNFDLYFKDSPLEYCFNSKSYGFKPVKVIDNHNFVSALKPGFDYSDEDKKAFLRFLYDKMTDDLKFTYDVITEQYTASRFGAIHIRTGDQFVKIPNADIRLDEDVAIERLRKFREEIILNNNYFKYDKFVIFTDSNILIDKIKREKDFRYVFYTLETEIIHTAYNNYTNEDKKKVLYTVAEMFCIPKYNHVIQFTSENNRFSAFSLLPCFLFDVKDNSDIKTMFKCNENCNFYSYNGAYIKKEDTKILLTI
jgi:hypothetical protein